MRLCCASALEPQLATVFRPVFKLIFRSFPNTGSSLGRRRQAPFRSDASLLRKLHAGSQAPAWEPGSGSSSFPNSGSWSFQNCIPKLKLGIELFKTQTIVYSPHSFEYQEINRMKTLTWLHLSDLHFCEAKTGWDAHRVLDPLLIDLQEMENKYGLLPQLIFFTGDMAYGTYGAGSGSTLAEQYEGIESFLTNIRRAFSVEVSKQNLFLVPGNHDVDRGEVTEALTEWIERQNDVENITRLIQTGNKQWRQYMERLHTYRQFLQKNGYAHLLGDLERLLYAETRNLSGINVGIAGFNSAWNCSRDREKGKLWLAGDWQNGTVTKALKNADLKIALIHHPPGWFVEQEDSKVRSQMERDFDFFLHGHEHQGWVNSSTDGHVRIAAAACYERADQENGYNFVRLDLEANTVEIWLRKYDDHGGGWIPRGISNKTNNDGLWLIKNDIYKLGQHLFANLPVPNTNANISHNNASAALIEQLCEKIDFLTPIQEPHFYLGIDSQPGHLAAGLIIERPRARERILKALDNRRNVIIAGPSGSGKSALMWDTVRAADNVSEWFRIPRLTAEQVPLLLQFAKSRQQTLSQANIGFVLDDIGSGLTKGWDALAKQAALLPGIFLLGSIREEDLFLLTERARTIEIREMGDEELAERLWKELRRRSQTQMPGWREAWRKSNGLLLEYTHILTAGSRLSDVLRSQIANRVRDVNRETELAVLRVAAAAGSVGAAIEVERLPETLKRPEAEISLALRRLLDEHLIRDVSPGRIGALHQLRASELFRLCHEFPPPTSQRTLVTTLHCLVAEDIETFVARTLAINSECQEKFVEEITARLNKEPNSALAAGAFRGLGQAQISASVCAWLERPEVQLIPKTHIKTAVLFSFPGTEMPDLPQFAPFQAASNSLRSIIQSCVVNDPRKQLILRLTEENLLKLFHRQANLSDLNALLSSLIGSDISNNVFELISSIKPDLLSGDLESVTKLLGTVILLDPSIAETWINAVGQDALLDRIGREVPWTCRPEIRYEIEGLAVCANIRYVSDRWQPDPHGEVVHLCEMMLAFVPKAELAISNAVGPDGKEVRYGDYTLATKRIPRKNLPPSALPDWNSRWGDAVADRITAPNHTDYLNRAVVLYVRLLPALEKFFDDCLRKGKISESRLQALGNIYIEAEALAPPKTTSGEPNGEPNGWISKLQYVLFDCSMNLINYFFQLPEHANRYVAWTGSIIEHIDAAIKEEPWELLSSGQPKELMRLRQIVEGLRYMGGESGVRNVNPLITWYKPKADRNNAFRSALLDVKHTINRRIIKTKTEINKALAAISPSMTAHVRLKEDAIAPWPPVEVLITVSVSGMAEWLYVVAENTEILRTIVGEGRNLILVPLINGVAVSFLALAGSDKLLPLTRKNICLDWLEREGISALNDIRVQAFSSITNPLYEISAIKRFGYGGENRPLLEQEALNSACQQLKGSLQHLRGLLASAPEVLAQIEELVEQAFSGQLSFAADMVSTFHGDFQAACIQVLTIQHELLQMDINEAAN